MKTKTVMSRKTSQARSSDMAEPPCGEYLQPRYYEKLLSIFGAGDDASVMLAAYRNFNKRRLVSIHNKAAMYLTHPQAAEILRMHSNPEREIEGCHEATEAADELVPVNLNDLKLGKRNEGAVLYGELCVKPFKFGRIYTLFEEAETGNAVVLSIVSPEHSSIDQSFAKMFFPQGRKIALKEPVLVQGEGDLVFINVNNPLSIDTVESLPVHADINIAVGTEKFKRWMSSGNKAYSAGEWEKCIRNHSKCVVCVCKGMHEDANIVREIYIERGMANIELYRREEALQDAEKVDPSGSVEGVEFKIRSLLSLGRYKDAFRLLQCSCALFVEKEEVFTAAYRKWSADYFDISEAIIRPGAGRRPDVLKPDGDFFGPVEIRMTSYGCGRGLFATENIEVGEVLLISKALAVSRKCTGDVFQNGLLQNVKDALRPCGEKTRQIFLSHRSKDLSLLIPEISDFVTETTGEYIVPTSRKQKVTVCERYEKMSDEEKDRAILHILNRIAFEDLSPAAMQENGEQSVIFNPVPTRLYYGVWLLPSFINHSCVPNAARINVGEILRIHAATAIGAGEEITIPYYNVLFPHPCREESSKIFGFSCLCKRCEVETKVIEHEPKTKKLYREYLSLGSSKMENRDSRLQSLAAQVEQCLKILKRMVKANQNIYYYEGWIRASFTPVYLALLVNRKRKLGKKALMDGSEIELDTLYDAANGILATCSGSLQHLIFWQRCLALWRDRAQKYEQWGEPSNTKIYEGNVCDARTCMNDTFPSVYGHQKEHVMQAIFKNIK